MSGNVLVSLTNLSVEILYRIFDESDGVTIFLSVRDVCQQFRAAIDTYHRYELDMASLFKPNFRRLLHLIRSECVTGFSLSDIEMPLEQIGLFLSPVGIRSIHSASFFDVAVYRSERSLLFSQPRHETRTHSSHPQLRSCNIGCRSGFNLLFFD